MYLLAAFLFALNGVAAKSAMNAGLDPMHLTQLRNAGSVVVLVIAVALTAPQHFRVTRRELPFLIAYGVIAFTLVQFLYFLTISRLNVGIGTLLAFLAPVLVALWLRFGRKRAVSNRIWVAIALTLIGLALVAQVWEGLTLDIVGLIAGLACAVALALYWLLGESGQTHRDSVSLTMWGFIFASIAWAIVSPWWSFPWTTLSLPTVPMADALPGFAVWVLMAWGVVMGTVVPFLLVLGSLRRLGLPERRPDAQPADHHRSRHRRHLAVRRPRRRHRLADRCTHRQRGRDGTVPRGRRSGLPHRLDRHPRHHRGRSRPVDQEGEGMSEPIMKGRGLVKRFGSVTGLNGADFDLFPGEVLAVIGDNGAGKSTLIKCFAGAHTPDEGQMWVEGKEVKFESTHEAREHGVETVFQTLAVAPALDIAANLYLGREQRKKGFLGTVFRSLDKKGMRKQSAEHLQNLGISTLQNITQSVETLSGGQRQAVSVARAAAFGSQVIILDEPTAALGVRESAKVLSLIQDLRDRGLSVVLISHNMPQVFEVSDRIHVQRLGHRAAVVTPQTASMNDAVAIMTGALEVPENEQQLTAVN